MNRMAAEGHAVHKGSGLQFCLHSGCQNGADVIRSNARLLLSQVQLYAVVRRQKYWGVNYRRLPCWPRGAHGLPEHSVLSHSAAPWLVVPIQEWTFTAGSSYTAARAAGKQYLRSGHAHSGRHVFKPPTFPVSVMLTSLLKAKIMQCLSCMSNSQLE